jgi:hypothetical protein
MGGAQRPQVIIAKWCFGVYNFKFLLNQGEMAITTILETTELYDFIMKLERNSDSI